MVATETIDSAEQRLHALLDLLIATKSDTDDNNHHLDEKVSRFKSITLTNSCGGLAESRRPDDHLIEEIIAQLRKANNDKFDDSFPDCIETDVAVPELTPGRLTNLKLITRPDTQRRTREEEKIMQQEPISAPPPTADQLREFMEREDSYPRIGPGYSDEISVVSDLTIPTVVNGVPVPEEEYYGAAPRQLPLNLGNGGGASMKRRNLVNAVKPQQSPLGLGSPPPPPQRRSPVPGQQPQPQRPRAAPKPGGAAAKRLKNYEQTMAKLGEGGGGGGGGAYGNEFDYADNADGSNFYMDGANSGGFNADWEDDGGHQMSGAAAAAAAKKRTPLPNRPKKSGVSPLAKSNVNQSIDMGRGPSKMSGSGRPQKDLEWQPPFGSPTFQGPKSGADDPLLIDEDGFLVAEQAGDPFKAQSDPFGHTSPDPFVASDPFNKQRSFGSTASDSFNRGYADNTFSPSNDPFQKPNKPTVRPPRQQRRMSDEMEYTMESEWAAEPDPRSRRPTVNQGGRPRRPGQQ